MIHKGSSQPLARYPWPTPVGSAWAVFGWKHVEAKGSDAITLEVAVRSSAKITDILLERFGCNDANIVSICSRCERLRTRGRTMQTGLESILTVLQHLGTHFNERHCLRILRYSTFPLGCFPSHPGSVIHSGHHDVKEKQVGSGSLHGGYIHRVNVATPWTFAEHLTDCRCVSLWWCAYSHSDRWG